MFNLSGSFFNGQSAARFASQLSITPEGQVCCIDDNGHQLQQSEFTELQISARLGNSPRYLLFADGSKFETLDNDGVDRLCRHFTHGDGSRWIHLVETHWQFLLVSLSAVVLVVWLTFAYGIPALADVIAQRLPARVATLAGEQTLQVLDQTMMGESKLPLERQQQLQNSMQLLLQDFPELPLRVLFRDGKQVGANAFALPDGTLVFTDQIVELSQSDEELLAVLAHEIGHIYHRHSRQMVVQNSLMTFVLVAVTGDVSGTAEIVLALPAFLTQMAYSRKLEAEADDFALIHLNAHRIPGHRFIDLMERLAASHAVKTSTADDSHVDSSQGSQGEGSEGKGSENKASEDSKQWQDYFSSHPPTPERLEKFR